MLSFESEVKKRGRKPKQPPVMQQDELDQLLAGINDVPDEERERRRQVLNEEMTDEDINQLIGNIQARGKKVTRTGHTTIQITPDEDRPSLLEQIQPKDEFEPDGNILKKIIPAKWEALVNILSFLTKDSDDAVIIENSIAMHTLKTGGILRVNMKDIFDEDITLHISSPKKWTRLFKMFKNENVFILNEENLFIITNGQIKLFLPKQISSVASSLVFPSFEKTEVISSMIFQKDARDKILNLATNVQFIEFLIQDSIFKAINIPSTALFVLPEYIKDPKIKELNNNTADITLRCSSFLPFPAETHQFTIGKNLETANYFVYTKCVSQLVEIETYEILDNMSGVSSLW